MFEAEGSEGGCGGGTGVRVGADGDVDDEVDEIESEGDGKAEGGGGGGRSTGGLYGNVSEISVSVVEVDPSEATFLICSSVRKFSCSSNSLCASSGCSADVVALVSGCGAVAEAEAFGLMTSMS